MDVSIIQDSLHGTIEVPFLCKQVIDTPQFDRLRSLKQLGCVHFVFPGGKHTRWEHSLGVMHLAGKLVRKLQADPSRNISEVDVLCVMLAGLCHDLGHGPFSHTWEAFVKEARKGHNWCHEETSIKMFEYLLTDNKLKNSFEDNGLLEKDITFIKEMIRSISLDEAEDWPYVGRGPEKYFLYEIVANKTTGMDVDKMDYFKRDDAALGTGTKFNFERYILTTSTKQDARGRTKLCIRDKELSNVQNLFCDRVSLHKAGYQHKTCLIINRMLLDALLLADDHLYEGTMKLSEACDDVEKFIELSDERIFREIQFSRNDNPQMQEAKQILMRIIKRELYKSVGKIEFCGEIGATAEFKINAEEVDGMHMNELILINKSVNMGGDKKINPVKNVQFIDKAGDNVKFNDNQLKQGLPPQVNYEELIIVSKRKKCNESDEKYFEKLSSKFSNKVGYSVHPKSQK